MDLYFVKNSVSLTRILEPHFSPGVIQNKKSILYIPNMIIRTETSVMANPDQAPLTLIRKIIPEKRNCRLLYPISMKTAILTCRQIARDYLLLSVFDFIIRINNILLALNLGVVCRNSLGLFLQQIVQIQLDSNRGGTPNRR